MQIKDKTAHNVLLSEEVVAQMVSAAASEVDGVSCLVPNPTFKNLFSSKTTKAVSVKYALDSMTIEMYVKIKMGVNITTLCEQIQENVKKTVQNMTGHAVSRVNIIVADIEIPT